MGATFYAKDKTCASCIYWSGKRCVKSTFSRTVEVDGYNKEEVCLANKIKTKPSASCSRWTKIDSVKM